MNINKGRWIFSTWGNLEVDCPNVFVGMRREEEMHLGRSTRFSDYEAQILILCVCAYVCVHICSSAAENVARRPKLDKNLFYQGEIQTLGANI